MSEDGHVFIKGRIKNMLLGSNGQNIYPEEIEDKLNSMTMVVESLIVQRDNKIVALVYPDFEAIKDMNLTESDLQGIMEHNIAELNSKLPAFSKIASVEIRREEFAKTPKRSIKRYLYN
jgi:long-chain acyl-CoA synthetase